jgi:hypothetical protein
VERRVYLQLTIGQIDIISVINRPPMRYDARAMRPQLTRSVATRRGRPQKYGQPARAVTVTLPESVLASLHAVDADLGRAIVELVERRTSSRAAPLRAAEITSYGRHAVIIVTPAKALKRLPGVQLVPVGSGRCLIALEPPYSIPRLELDIRDLLTQPDLAGAERQALEGVADILRGARASRDVTPEERTIIVLKSRRKPR